MLREVRCPTCGKMLAKVKTERATFETFCRVCKKLIQIELMSDSKPVEAAQPREGTPVVKTPTSD